ncbi:hypothetical protein AVEN_105192-1 [Araneus ventricosus]|uniref:DDE-1 domain-containing protein n=1 Tax=Araneus ventricosus TaxID=182803 RepID=A0A4Y2MEW7_ARAVE|nr:hypothetical protein AVEN_105192-1 [Araneus ventricosus]
MCKLAWDKVSERTIMKCFHKAGFVKKETEAGMRTMSTWTKMWLCVTSQLMRTLVVIAQLAVNNQAEDGLTGDEEDKEIQQKPLPSA